MGGLIILASVFVCTLAIQGAATRVMSLRDGTKKMSKSDASDLSRINMTDDADTIAKKIQKAKTDPLPLPGSEAELETITEAYVGVHYGELPHGAEDLQRIRECWARVRWRDQQKEVQ